MKEPNKSDKNQIDSREDRTLSITMNDLNAMGYTDDFKAEDDCIHAIYAKKDYQPQDLLIEKFYRFEGMTDPGDQTQLMAIKSNDGIKGTLVMSYSSEHNQNTELIKQIPRSEDLQDR